jgi:hypothetical protein
LKSYSDWLEAPPFVNTVISRNIPLKTWVFYMYIIWAILSDSVSNKCKYLFRNRAFCFTRCSHAGCGTIDDRPNPPSPEERTLTQSSKCTSIVILLELDLLPNF